MSVIKEALFLLFILQISAFNTNFAFGQSFSSERPTIVLDPGHGGRDHGCIGGHSHEKEIVLSIAKRLSGLIDKAMPNADVILTRNQDHFVSLEKRSTIANEASADLFISLHCNAIEIPSVHGCETYVMGLHNTEENLAVAKRENNAILYEQDFQSTYGGFDPNSDEGHIILSMYQNTHLSQSIKFAQKIESSLSTFANRKSRGVKQAGFVVLRKTAMPSVLIELGFLTHPKEEGFLLSAEGQQSIAESLLNAITWYFENMEQEIPLAYLLPNNKLEQQNNIPNKTRTVHYTEQAGNPSQNNIGLKSQNNHNVANRLESKQVEYRIQIAATKNETSFDIELDGLDDEIIVSFKESGLHKYQFGAFTSIKEASSAKSLLRNHGYNAAFIVPYLDGKKINIELAKQIEQESHRMANLHP